jgi:putative ubiquitin-RnfH superfamily antitoxin RatB of RatAB toxin-antitoxin module
VESSDPVAAAAAEPPLRVSVVLAEPHGARCVDLELAPGATLAQAALASGLWRPESGLALGLWGHRLPGDTPLAGGDRVEIYRPLLIEPKDARRHRAELRRALKPRG